MIFEDECTDDLTIGLQSSGALDPTQSRQVMYLGNFIWTIFSCCWLLLHQHLRQIAVGGDLAKFQSDGVGSMTPAATSQPDGSDPKPPPVKGKRQVPLGKQVSNKLSSSSSKLTELLAWEAKVTDNQTLYLVFVYIVHFFNWNLYPGCDVKLFGNKTIGSALGLPPFWMGSKQSSIPAKVLSMMPRLLWKVATRRHWGSLNKTFRMTKF